ncbi:MAG: DUF2384 domain-containing protein [Neomegalonema sp.]|nr:DUF2384 domain-containing protein [Neomegalonema sp.]
MARSAQATSALTEPQRIAQILGLPGRSAHPVALAETIANGLPVKAAEALRALLGAPAFEHVLSESTLRRSRRQDRPLTPQSSEKLYEFARVYALAEEVYGGDREKVARFLEAPHPMLEGKTPLEMTVSSSAGADAVSALLHRVIAGFAA